jgi:asparagine synthase (glutamine-hydrolysing)
MCGIAGTFAYGATLAAGSERADEVRRMCERMASRGPDGHGIWTSGDERVVLGHRRLSIIDLSDRASQPMLSATGKLAITFNGEIYNYRELKAGLQRRGCVFRTTSDTEVLLHLYAEHGESMTDVLRGMFAFTIWDEAKGALFMARDPYGIKPLYYADHGGVFRFASQVKALLAGGGVSKEQDAAGLVGFLLFGSVPEPFTLYRSIRALPAGRRLSVSADGAGEPRRYFDLARVFLEADTRSGTADDVREALRESTRAHLVADVPVGVFLSAGVDSGALAALCAEAAEGTTRGVTIAFDEFRGQANDEAPLAASIAARYGIEHTSRTVTRAELMSDLPGLLDAMDQPSIDGVNTWFVSKAARELGLKVAISGLGGDELWGGYPSFRDLPRWVNAMRVPNRVPGLGQAVRRLGAYVLARSSISPKLAGLAEYGGSWSGAYLLRRGLFMPWELTDLLEDATVEEGLARLAPLEHIARAIQPDPGTDFGRVATLEATLYMRNQLLRDTDWASMAHSLEVRTPLVDAQLLQRVAPIVLHSHDGNGKALLGEAPATPLPAEVMNRPKTGFATPIARWLIDSPDLDGWRRVPALARSGCHWSRRFAYVALRNFVASDSGLRAYAS